ncbi:MAG TPA: uroporphyrinogen-III C-methyltransferase, partial [Thermohalobaculum sp.]|nr:uroporphyrinogen-III C-methyltransferase [Thermohalobaculum sp.]
GGDRAGAEAALEAAIEAGGAPAGQQAPRVALVGAGPGSADLITLRGVERLQSADIVFHDRLVDPGVLELARRDAERVAVGKAPGAHAWPQERINRAMVAAARRGLRVVRLKGGDPGIFARGTEEADALDVAGIGWEVVPGVTAASAAAADTGTFLTERGEIRSLVLTTGQTADGEAPDWAEHARRGSAVAFYMAVSAAPRIAAELIRAGVPESLGVDIIERAGTPAMRHLKTTLGCLAYTVEAAAVENPAVLMLRWRRGAAAEKGSTVVPFAEKGRPHAHHRRAEADCGFEVAAHPH